MEISVICGNSQENAVYLMRNFNPKLEKKMVGKFTVLFDCVPEILFFGGELEKAFCIGLF